MTADPSADQAGAAAGELRHAAAELLDALAADSAEVSPDGYDERTAAAVRRLAMLVRVPRAGQAPYSIHSSSCRAISGGS